ncbi:MAG: homoserine kinase [Elusimicrobiota bacterium]
MTTKIKAPLFSVRVKVPATSANLGPGFDTLGVALAHYSELTMTAWGKGAAPGLSIRISGEGAGSIAKDARNLVFRAARRVLDKSALSYRTLELRLTNRIPLARGLGSSSAAIVAGLAAANAGCGNPFPPEELLEMAAEQEGHPDNVAPALLGGLCASAMLQGKARAVSFRDGKFFEGLRAVACVPAFELRTESARKVLPKRVSRRDAVFNVSRAALLVAALVGRRRDLLAEAMQDRLHQPYRKKFIPGWDDVNRSAARAGALGVALSGAGPSLLAFSVPGKADAVGRAMCAAFSRHGVSAKYLNLGFDLKGARVTAA